MKLLFASNNAHKLEEVRRILAPIEILGLADIGCHTDIEENGTTLEENSAIKARFVYAWVQRERPDVVYDGIIADDTGLEIEALGGQPGVYTARWAGEPANDAANRQKALRELLDKDNRNAQFRTVITWISPKGEQKQVEGAVKGYMAEQESGCKGFGYDSLFVPEGYDETFAQLPSECKNSISHRARALANLKKILL